MLDQKNIDFDIFDIAKIFKKTPYITDMKPGGKYVAKDLYEAGGVQMILKVLLDAGFLHGDCMTRKSPLTHLLPRLLSCCP